MNTKYGDAKTIEFSAKCSDLFSAMIKDADGKTLAETSSDYVPDFFPEEHYGDYVILDVDLETGQILNWKKPSKTTLETQIAKWKSEED